MFAMFTSLDKKKLNDALQLLLKKLCDDLKSANIDDTRSVFEHFVKRERSLISFIRTQFGMNPNS